MSKYYDKVLSRIGKSKDIEVTEYAGMIYVSSLYWVDDSLSISLLSPYLGESEITVRFKGVPIQGLTPEEEVTIVEKIKERLDIKEAKRRLEEYERHKKILEEL